MKLTGIEVGMVCFKTTGRRAGKKVVVVGFDKKTGMAIIEGEAEKPRKCNVFHLWPTNEKISVDYSRKIDNVPETEKKLPKEKNKTEEKHKKTETKKTKHAGKKDSKAKRK